MSRPAALVARSKVMRTLLNEARRYAAAEANVLLSGETGVGKDAVARLMHLAGPRRKEPFLVVDCAGLPATLVESELFGHERGAFTDATVARAGRFEAAGRGTVYLDAVSSLTPDAQGAILRVVEEKRVTRLGGSSALDVRARIISSADAGIEQAVRDGSFRTDLYHRLSVLPLVIPPLRERTEDILPMARTFITAISTEHQRPAPSLAASAEDVLLRYHWPGNVRELRHTIERAIVGFAAADPRRQRSVPRASRTHAPDAGTGRAPLHRARAARGQGQPDARGGDPRDQPEGAMGKAQALRHLVIS
jgi:transcriptional regulator with GAF, ATPase, and Fis domain